MWDDLFGQSIKAGQPPLHLPNGWPISIQRSLNVASFLEHEGGVLCNHDTFICKRSCFIVNNYCWSIIINGYIREFDWRAGRASVTSGSWSCWNCCYWLVGSNWCYWIRCRPKCGLECRSLPYLWLSRWWRWRWWRRAITFVFPRTVSCRRNWQFKHKLNGIVDG